MHINLVVRKTFTYTERDVALYALGVGACLKDALDDKELKYVYHPDHAHQQSIQVFCPPFIIFCRYWYIIHSRDNFVACAGAFVFLGIILGLDDS